MGKPNYVCAACSEDFTRIWNANRHNTTQHQELAEIVSVGEHTLRRNNINIVGSGGISSCRQTCCANEDQDLEDVLLSHALEKLAPGFEHMKRVMSDFALEERQKIQGQTIILPLIRLILSAR